MAGLAAAVSNVGASVGQVRTRDHSQAIHLKEQERLPDDPKSAALRLIQRIMTETGATGHDLDVLA